MAVFILDFSSLLFVGIVEGTFLGFETLGVLVGQNQHELPFGNFDGVMICFLFQKIFLQLSLYSIQNLGYQICESTLF